MKLVKLEKDKTLKIAYEITYFLNPDYLYVPVEKNKLVVKQNEQIYKNEVIAIGKKNIISPVSGIAYGLKKSYSNNSLKDALVIANDFREISKDNSRGKYKTNIPNILKVLEENKNIELLNKFKSNKIYKNIVISAINDNPYIYNEIFLLKENINELLELIHELSLLYKSDNNLLAIKNNESFIIDECLNVIGIYPEININLVNDEYLLGKEKYLLDTLGFKKSTLFLTVSDLLVLNNLLKKKITTTKIITISGNAIEDNKVLRIKKYTLLSDILNKYINIKSDKYRIIINGLMNGYEINNPDIFPITDDVISIHIMHREQNIREECINCGKCIKVCPVGVNPLNGNNKKNCIDCGLCSYICPVYINLREKLKEGIYNE